MVGIVGCGSGSLDTATVAPPATPAPAPAPVAPEPSTPNDTSQPVEPPTSDTATARGTEGRVTIESAQRSGTTVSVVGTATVPDGAFVAYEVVPIADGMPVREGAARVDGERFSFDVSVSGFPSGPVEVWVAFVTILGGPTYDATQPDAVLDLYGPMGQKITGPNVTPGPLALVEAIEIVG